MTSRSGVQTSRSGVQTSRSGVQTPRTVVVVGAGLAAASCCEELRDRGYDGRLVLVGAEPHLPYERPPLSKECLTGADVAKAFVHDETWYDEHGVELRLGTRAVDLDPETHTVRAGSDEVGYDRLLLATGSTARTLPFADPRAEPVHTLRTIDDSQRLAAALAAGGRIAVLGAGWIGLEVAAAARTAGCEVTVVEPASHPLLRVLGPEVGALFAQLHGSHGVDLRTGVTPTAVSATDQGAEVHLDDGSTVAADAVVVGIGASPTTDLAERAGLEVDHGVVVDELLRSSHPDVLAAGDVANAYHPLLGRHLRVEHWDNAIHQGRAAAATMLGGERPYDRLPYFFSDQYDLGMEYVGSTVDGYDELVLRGEPARQVFTALWLKDGRAVAGMQANDWDATEHLRRVLSTEDVDPDRLRDPAVSLDQLAT